jgi:hypothetical protein
VDPAAGDADLIIAVFRGRRDAWLSGVDNGLKYLVDHVYPGSGATIDTCRDAIGNPGNGYGEEHVVDKTSIAPDTEWRIPVGPLKGTKPDGRTYILKATLTDGGGGVAQQSTTTELHSTVVDGKAYFYEQCGPTGPPPFDIDQAKGVITSYVTALAQSRFSDAYDILCSSTRASETLTSYKAYIQRTYGRITAFHFSSDAEDGGLRPTISSGLASIHVFINAGALGGDRTAEIDSNQGSPCVVAVQQNTD